MKITNKTKGTVIASEAGYARSLPERMKGLLGRSSLAQGEGLVIAPCSAIHTIGMRFAIDVVFFDRDNRAVSIIEGIKPCRMTGWRPRAHGVVELPAGALTGSPVEIGDELVFE